MDQEEFDERKPVASAAASEERWANPHRMTMMGKRTPPI